MDAKEAVRPVRVGILGATGAVGREMMRLLAERNFPLMELRLLASSASVGKFLSFAGTSIPVIKAAESAFHGLDIVLGAADAAVARRFAPAITDAGAVFIDNSSAFRMQPDVPLVVPEINGRDALTHHGIIANPNCSTIITLMAVYPLHRISPIQSMVAATYQAVSGAGAKGPVELAAQMAAFDSTESAPPQVFAYPIAGNVIPYIGSVTDAGYTTEEMKMQNEGRRILHAPTLHVSCTCVRVPVMRSHSIAVTVRTAAPISIAAAKTVIAAAPGCRLVDEPAAGRYPMPLEASEQDAVLVGRIRPDLTDPCGIVLWCCGDQLRKGAAANAVQIAELLL